jgi:hypothetical protein
MGLIADMVVQYQVLGKMLAEGSWRKTLTFWSFGRLLDLPKTCRSFTQRSKPLPSAIAA